MTELELRHLRREKWRLEGEPIRTIEEAREFVDSVGMCLMYPTRPMPLLPTFIGAIAGSDQKLLTRNTALNDPCGMQTEELLARLAREKSVHEAQLHGETLVLSAQLFPYFYALASDRKPKQPIVSRTRPLSQHLFRKLEERGPLSRAQLQEQLGGALSEVALDRTLQELWTALKVTRVDHRSDGEDRWDVYYRWAPEAVNEGVRLSDAEALSALISKYLDCVVAATQDEIETTFSAITSRTRVAEVVRSLLSAREFTYTPSETRTLITVAHSIARPESPRAQVDGRGGRLRQGDAMADAPGSRGLVIAIDGPAGAGKSTLASRLARKMGYLNIETGAMYRALALKAVENDVDVDDEKALLDLALGSKITLEPQIDGNRVKLDNTDVSTRIREKDVTDAASRVSVHPAVREWMVRKQRELGAAGGVVMEGRDIGTAVFPKADIKIFLDAAPEVRGNRRFHQNPISEPSAAVLAEMRARDERDRTRPVSPLVAAKDAVLIDSTNMTLEQVIERAEQIVHEQISSPRRHGEKQSREG